jgi:hypothetical protein
MKFSLAARENIAIYLQLPVPNLCMQLGILLL